MKTIGAIEAAIIEAYYVLGGKWQRIEDVAAKAGLTADEMREGVLNLYGDEDFQVEQRPFGHRVTAESRRHAVHIGGEDLHLIRWGA